MKSMFLLCGVLGAVSAASDCQADDTSLMQVRSLVRTIKAKGSNNPKDLLKNMRHVANSLLEGSDIMMSADELSEALDATADRLATVKASILDDVQTAQQQINDAISGVLVCRDPEMAVQRLAGWVSQRSAAVETCQSTLEELQTAQTEQCNTAEDCLCDEARVRTTDQEALCASMIETYEATFCDHHHACTTLSQCHVQEAAVYQRERADVETLMARLEQEYIAVEQGLCLEILIQQATTAEPMTPITPEAMLACNDVDVSAISIDYPPLPAPPAACPAHEHGSPPCVEPRPDGEWVVPTSWTLSASSSYDHRYPPNNLKVRDGLPWSSSRDGFPHSLTFNAGEEVELAGFATGTALIHSDWGWDLRTFKDFKFKKSDDGITYTEVLSGEGANLGLGGRQEFFFRPQSAQWWQLEMANNHRGDDAVAIVQYVEFQQVQRTVDRAGQRCWADCGEASGYCDWCGSGSACCRENWSRAQPEECGEDRAQYSGLSTGSHLCVTVAQIPRTVDRAGQGCNWAACGEKSGYCDWCGSGNACCRQNWSRAQPEECGEDRAQYSGLFTSGHECVRVRPR